MKRLWLLPWLLVLCSQGGALGADGISHVRDDAVAIVRVKGLREAYRAWTVSDLGRGFADLPAWREWQGSNDARKASEAILQFERLLDVDLAGLRDEVLGDEVVLSVHPTGEAGSYAGLVLVHPRDRAMAARLMDEIGRMQRASGELLDEETRTHAGLDYQVRSKRGGALPDYLFLLDGVLAWSNDEGLVRHVIEVESRGDGRSPAWARRMLERLPGEAVVVGLAERRLWASALESARGAGRDVDPNTREFLELADSVEGLGLGLVVRDGLALHVVEPLAPAGLPVGWMGLLAARGEVGSGGWPEGSSHLVRGALVIEVGRLAERLMAGIRATDPRRADRLSEALGGLLEVEDALVRLSEMGPRVMVEVVPGDGEAPSGEVAPYRLSLAVSLSEGSSLGPKLGSLARALMNLAALDRGDEAQVVRSESDASRRWELRLPGRSVAVEVRSSAVVLSLAEGAADASTESWKGDETVPGPDALSGGGRKAEFEVDLGRLSAWLRAGSSYWVERFREDGPRDEAVARRDFERLLEVLALFSTARVWHAVEEEGRVLHQAIELRRATRSAGQPGATGR